MNTKKTIQKILFIGMWLVIGAGMLSLFIAAMSKQKQEACKGYSVAIKAARNADFFLDEGTITSLLKKAAKGNIKGQSKAVFNLQQMEQMLENNVWIRDAQLYFDNKAILHVSVEEREPVARIFTTNGRSFYIDSSRRLLPLSEKALIKIPVFTNFPDKNTYTYEDSLLLEDISVTAQYISGHPFWSSQVAQIDIVAGLREMEMVPVVGRHLVRLGDGENIAGKFQRLLAFYQQVLNKTGFDHYTTIDVRFAGQVVAAKSDNPRVDSVKYMKYVQELMKQSQAMEEEEMNTTHPVTNAYPAPYETPMKPARRPRAVMPDRQR